MKEERKCINMSQTNVNIRMDEELKKKFEQFCSDIGMSMTTAICVFVKKAVKEQKIPFEITAKGHFCRPIHIKRLKSNRRSRKWKVKTSN